MSWFDIAIFTAPILSGSLSLLASSTIIWKIFQSETKLKAPYCRLLFGMTFYDVIFSCANIASTMPVPAVVSPTSSFGAVGNDITCSIQGMTFAFAGNILAFYNLSLYVYFLCIISYSMADDRFSQSIEPFLHVVPFIFSAASTVYLSVNDYIHEAEYFCFISVKSDETMNKRLVYIFSFFPITFIFCGFMLIMGIITWTVWNQERRMDQYRFQFGTQSESSSFSFFRTKPSTPSVNSNSRSNLPQRNRARGRERVMSVKRQAKAFLGAFLLSYVPTFICFFSSSDEEYVDGPHWIVTLLAFTSYPLQGVFILCAHLQPYVRRLRKENANLSYGQALKRAVITYDNEIDRLAAIPSSKTSLTRILPNRTTARRSSRHIGIIGEVPSTRKIQWKMRLFRNFKSNNQERSLHVETEL